MSFCFCMSLDDIFSDMFEPCALGFFSLSHVLHNKM